jgi:uncharacterized protein
MAQHATHVASTFRTLAFACLMFATLVPVCTARALEGTHERPDYSVTRQQLQRLHKDADEGSAFAQFVLGAMYHLGEVVPQDYTESAKWISRAADQGFIVAQFALGEMYALGQGVPEDAVLAHKWFNLSAAQAARITGANKLTHRAAEMRDALERTMSPAQIEEAQKLARQWKPNSERN